MTSREIAAHRIAARLPDRPGDVGIDPALIPLLTAVVIELVRALRACYPTPDAAFAYLTRDFGPLQWWRTSKRERLVNEAIVTALSAARAPAGIYVLGQTVLIIQAIRTALRDDLSRGLLAGLYREGA